MMEFLTRIAMTLCILGVASTASAQQSIKGCEIRPRTGCAGADLSNETLLKASLPGADLSNANLAGADLRGADLNRADLSGADLTAAQLRAVDLSRANLSGADLSRADLHYATLGGAIWVDGRTCAEESIGGCQ